jgi:hypothetical protein
MGVAMRKLALIIFAGAATLAAMPAQAQWRDGYRYERPYYGHRYNEGRYYRYDGRDRQPLSVYCRMGSQAPRSVWDDCRRAGYW